jgi:hypothetical protein
MPVTKIRGSLQLKSGSLRGEEIKDKSITGDDIALGSLTGGLLANGTVTAQQIDGATLAGEGLVFNGTTRALDLNVDLGSFQLALDTLTASANLTQAGNTFNGASQLVQLLTDGKLPPLDGSNLSNVSALPITFVDLEEPVGAINGVNSSFTLAFTPIFGSLHVYLNGILMRAGAANDYTVTGSSITMASAPTSGSVLLASYRT